MYAELLMEKYAEVHHSRDGTGIKTLDYCIKKKTDHYNNAINTYVYKTASQCGCVSCSVCSNKWCKPYL